MVLESTIICVDNSEYMRNGDYLPTRLQAQQDAVNTICRFKLRSNPENNVGLITLSNNAEIVATLTTDVGKILTSLHHVQPGGMLNLLTGLRIAHLALKHRGSRAHRMRIVAFVGSPLASDEKEVVRVAKKLKKESVVLDIINFGETENNTKLLESLINTVNGKDCSNSHLVTIPAPCSHLADALLTSPVMATEEGGTVAAQFAGGSAFEFGVDPNEDPELALALRVSMEEQRQRQQEEERRTAGDSAPPAAGGEAAAGADAAAPAAAGDSTPAATPASDGSGSTPASATSAASSAAAGGGDGTSEEAMLQQALAMSLEAGGAAAAGAATTATTGAATPAPAASAPSSAVSSVPDFATMTEEEQIAYAMQISMQDCDAMEVDPNAATSETPAAAAKSETTAAPAAAEEDLTSVMADAAFLEGVLNKLPGVNPNSEVVKQAIDSYTSAGATGSEEDDKKESDKKKKKTDDKKE